MFQSQYFTGRGSFDGSSSMEPPSRGGDQDLANNTRSLDPISHLQSPRGYGLEEENSDLKKREAKVSKRNDLNSTSRSFSLTIDFSLLSLPAHCSLGY